MLVLSSQAGLLGSNAVVWLCDQEPVRSFQKGPPPEKAKLRRWWTYLSQLRLTVHHIQGVKNECADYISRNNFDALIGARSEALAKEAFSRMDVHLDLNMTMIRPLDGLQQSEYLKEFGNIYKRLEKRLKPLCNRCIVADLSCNCEACSLDAPGVVTPDTAPDISELN